MLVKFVNDMRTELHELDSLGRAFGLAPFHFRHLRALASKTVLAFWHPISYTISSEGNGPSTYLIEGTKMLTLTAHQIAAIKNFSAGLISLTDLVFAIYSSVEDGANVMHVVALERTLDQLSTTMCGAESEHPKINVECDGADFFMVVAQEIGGELKYATVNCTN